MIVISDTTAISTLAIINQLSLLNLLYGEVIVPPKVMAELNQHPIETARERILEVSWIKVVAPRSMIVVANYVNEIHAGELEAIALAKELNATVLLIDDLAGRTIAKKLNLHVTGLAGIALRAKEKGIINNVMPIVDQLRNAGLWISDLFYQEIKKLANE